MDLGWLLPGPKAAYEGGKALWNWGKERPTAPQAQQSPYTEDWQNLIGQLQQQSAGNGPSMADNAFKQASDQNRNTTLSMSRNGSAGGARQAGMNMAQGQNQLMGNYANAKLQEQLMARQSLMGALGGAGQAWWDPTKANLMAQMSTPSNLQMLMSFLQQGTSSGAQVASMAAGKPPVA